ncbi:efflux transporter outer membrane subunit [Glaciimonas sp. GG7]
MKITTMQSKKILLNVSITMVAVSLLASCAAPVPYQNVPMTIPTQWQHSAETNTSTATLNDHWWENFNDPVLNQLIALALARNNDLAGAAILVRRAQLQAGLAVINPTVSLGLSTANNRNLRGQPNISNSQTLTGSVGYQLDLWGNLAKQRNVAEWEAQATEEDRQSAALALIGTTATLYWKIANAQQHLDVNDQSIVYLGKILEMVRLQHDAGAVTSLEVLQAEQSLAVQQAARTQLLQQLVQYRAAFAILFNGPPGDSYPESSTLSALSIQALPTIAAGLPSQLLSRRPDLRAAELRLREMLTTVEVTRTNYYPALSLTGSLGSSSTALSNLLQNPVGTLATGLTFPFLQWNQMQLSIKVSQANYEKAVIDFRQTFYKALSDVEIALSARTQFQAQASKLAQSLAAANQIERLYQERYREGAVALRVWLDAQDTLRASQLAQADNMLNLLISQVTLYQALGGDARVTPDEMTHTE